MCVCATIIYDEMKAWVTHLGRLRIIRKRIGLLPLLRNGGDGRDGSVLCCAVSNSDDIACGGGGDVHDGLVDAIDASRIACLVASIYDDDVGVRGGGGGAGHRIWNYHTHNIHYCLTLAMVMVADDNSITTQFET